MHLYQRAIDQEQHTTAMNNLEYVFHYGANGVDVHLQRAKDLYQQAIVLDNNSKSMYHLGCLLQHADNAVIQKDVPKTKELYERSIAESNDVDSKFALAKLLETGDERVAREPKQALELYDSLVVDHEHGDALRRISKLLEEGSEEPNGLKPDAQRAIEVYVKAMDGKLRKGACEMLSRLLDHYDRGISFADKE